MQKQLRSSLQRGEVVGAGRIYVGPAGWSYPDWSGYVYPTRRPKDFHQATYLAEFFDTIEINTSFYNPIRADHAKGWLDRVAANRSFLFTAKLWQGFTHGSPGVLPAASSDDERVVREGFEPLLAAGKLGTVLVQFPFSFHRTTETAAYLANLLKRFADYPLTVELRHATWQVPETFAFLRERQVAFCNIDQPIIGKSMEPSAELTSAVGYVRFHGRRYDTWFSDDATVPGHERYNYLYSAEELSPWIARIRSIAEHTRKVFVVTNNHFQGKGVVNALQIISSLSGSKVKVPDPLRQRFPELEGISSEMPAEPTLFPLVEPTARKSKPATS